MPPGCAPCPVPASLDMLGQPTAGPTPSEGADSGQPSSSNLGEAQLLRGNEGGRSPPCSCWPCGASCAEIGFCSGAGEQREPSRSSLGIWRGSLGRGTPGKGPGRGKVSVPLAERAPAPSPVWLEAALLFTTRPPLGPRLCHLFSLVSASVTPAKPRVCVCASDPGFSQIRGASSRRQTRPPHCDDSSAHRTITGQSQARCTEEELFRQQPMALGEGGPPESGLRGAGCGEADSSLASGLACPASTPGQPSSPDQVGMQLSLRPATSLARDSYPRTVVFQL